SFFPLMGEGLYLEAFVEFLKSIVLNLPALIGDLFGAIGIYLYFKKENRKNMFLSLTFWFMIVSLIVGSGFWFLWDWGYKIPFLNGFLAYRFVYYARAVSLIIFAAFAISKLKNLKIPKEAVLKKIMISSTLSLLLIGFLLGVYVAPASYTQKLEEAPLGNELKEVWEYIRATIPKDEARIFNQNFFDNVKEPLVTSDSIAPVLGPYYTDYHHFFGSWYTSLNKLDEVIKTEGQFMFGKKIEEISQEEISENFKKFNIKYVLAVEPNLQKKMVDAGYEVIFRTEHLQLFEVNNYTPSWFMFKGEANLISFESQNVFFSTSSMNENQLVFKMAFHPYWKAYVDGNEVSVKESEGLIALYVPSGEHTVLLSFEPKKWGHILVSVLAAVIALVILVKVYLKGND
ncbi:MAG: hypothetical protein WC595_05120, partial [Candidatus Nanoarchaeia archaeon]